MILGIGIDLLRAERIERPSQNEAFRQRIFTDSERRYAEQRHNAPEVYAGFFCAKEAVMKALGTGMRGMRMTEIDVLHDALGKPYVRLSGGAADAMQRLGGKKIFISITHDGEYCAAQAVLESD